MGDNSSLQCHQNSVTSGDECSACTVCSAQKTMLEYWLDSLRLFPGSYVLA